MRRRDDERDGSFNLDGIVATDISANENAGTAVLIQPDGKIVVAGFARTGPGLTIDFAVARYETYGFLDTTFGTNGIVTTPVGSSADWATSIALQTDGKIVVAGYTTTVGEDYALVRYNADGSLDATFDSDGIVTTDISGDNDRATALDLQSDGKIVSAGGTTVTRYNTEFRLRAACGTGFGLVPLFLFGVPPSGGPG